VKHFLAFCMFFSLLAGALASAPAHSRGREIPGVLVLVGMQECCAQEAWPAVEAHLAREFQAMGFAVRVVPGRAQDEKSRREELQDLTDSGDAACAVRVVRPTGGSGAVELWLNDRITGKMLFRRLKLPVDAGGTRAEVTALRVVEMLRVSLMELSLPESPKPRLAPAVRKLAPVPVVVPHWVDLTTGMGLWVSPGGLPVLGVTAIGVRLHLAHDLSIIGELALSPLARELEAGDAASAIDLGTAFAWGAWRTGPLEDFRFSFGAGAGVHAYTATGLRAGVSSVTRADTTHVAAFALRADFEWHFHERIHFTLSSRVGIDVPEVVLSFGREEIARAGRPWVEVLFGLQLPLF
jgi:hypothetical protein